MLVHVCFNITCRCGLFNKKSDFIWKYKESYQTIIMWIMLINKHVKALVPIHYVTFWDYYFSHFHIKQTKLLYICDYQVSKIIFCLHYLLLLVSITYIRLISWLQNQNTCNNSITSATCHIIELSHHSRLSLICSASGVNPIKFCWAQSLTDSFSE